jgi:hypothetical protein
MDLGITVVPNGALWLHDHFPHANLKWLRTLMRKISLLRRRGEGTKSRFMMDDGETVQTIDNVTTIEVNAERHTTTITSVLSSYS